VRRAGFAYRQEYWRFLRRYKMISQFTWPNFHGGNAEEGTKVLLEVRGFISDVTFGKTKIFIRSPSTLFQLEQKRSSLIPGIVIFLQKLLRGALARKLYKRMVAARMIWNKYRKYKMRTYINTLHQTFRNVKSMKDHGACLQWPTPPRALRQTSAKFQAMFTRWRAYQVIKRIPPEDRNLLRRKLLAWELLGGQRRQWGQGRRWYGDYLSQENLGPEYSAALQVIRDKDRGNNIVFSSRVMKVNRLNKTNDRFMILSESHLYKVNPKKGKLMQSYQLSDVMGVSCGPRPHQLVVLHMRDKKDLVFSLITPEGEDRIGELVAVLATAKMGAQFKVSVTEEMHCFIGGKSVTVLVQEDMNSPVARFSKSNTGYTFSYPA